MTNVEACGHCSKAVCSCTTADRSNPSWGCETGSINYDVDGKTVTKRLFCNGAERD